MRVLVVEDDPLGQESLCMLLRLCGHEADHAGSGHGALTRLAAAPPPDALVLDICMPGMDGATLLGKLREDPRWASTPVVVMSALSRETLTAFEADFPGVRVFQKGGSPEALLRLLAEIDRARPATRPQPATGGS